MNFAFDKTNILIGKNGKLGSMNIFFCLNFLQIKQVLLKTIRCKSVNSFSLSIFMVCLTANPVSSTTFFWRPFLLLFLFFPTFDFNLLRNCHLKKENHLDLTAVTVISVPFFHFTRIFPFKNSLCSSGKKFELLWLQTTKFL